MPCILRAPEQSVSANHRGRTHSHHFYSVDCLDLKVRNGIETPAVLRREIGMRVRALRM
jgi:hypothetical protein